MSDVKLLPIPATAALDDAIIEIESGFLFERYGVPVDSVDLEHFRKALCILKLLAAVQS